MSFTDKIVVITGGSQGFGKSLAKALSSAGGIVTISSENSDRLNVTATELGINAITADVTKKESIAELASKVVKEYGRIDVWINNAGIQIAPTNIEDVVDGKLRNLLDVNFFGYLYGMQAAIPVMRSQGQGIIVNINSTAGLDGKPGISGYVASKFAIKGLTQSARKELAGSNIIVYGIHPGGMQTEIYKEDYPVDFKEYMTVDYAVQKVMDNFASDQPVLDLVIRRPKV